MFNDTPARKTDDMTQMHITRVSHVKSARTCRYEVGLLSLRTSIQNCRSPVVRCRRPVQSDTCSLSTQILVSFSAWTLSSSSCLRCLIVSIRASHWAATVASNSAQLPWKHKTTHVKYLFIYLFIHLFMYSFIHLFIHSFIYLFTYLLTDWLTDWLMIDWLTDWLAYWLTDWQMTDWLTDWLTGWLTDRWLTDWWLTDWLMTDWLTGLLTDWWLTDWLTYLLIYWFTYLLTYLLTYLPTYLLIYLSIHSISFINEYTGNKNIFIWKKLFIDGNWSQSVHTSGGCLHHGYDYSCKIYFKKYN